MNGEIERGLMARPVAIANECIIPILVKSRGYQEKLKQSTEKAAKSKHYRWLFFVLVSVIVGGKIANATSKAVALDKRSTKEKSRLVALFKLLVARTKKLVLPIIRSSGQASMKLLASVGLTRQ